MSMSTRMSRPAHVAHAHGMGRRAGSGGHRRLPSTRLGRGRGGQGICGPHPCALGTWHSRTPLAHGDTRAGASLPLGNIAVGAAAAVPALCVCVPCPPVLPEPGTGGRGGRFHPPFSQPRSRARGSFWERSRKASTSLHRGTSCTPDRTPQPPTASLTPPSTLGPGGTLNAAVLQGVQAGLWQWLSPPSSVCAGMGLGWLCWGWPGERCSFQASRSICKHGSFGGGPQGAPRASAVGHSVQRRSHSPQ